MSAAITIGGTACIIIEDTYDQTNNLNERQRLVCDVIDYTGIAHFVKGEQVVVTDPVLGVLFNGFLNADQEFPVYPAGAIRHTIDAIDLHYLADKRTYTQVYDAPTYAGNIVVDQLNTVLLAEGIAQNFSQHTDSTLANFNQGIISSTIGASNVGTGDLELLPAGSNLTITENSTGTFATGTLTNCVASGGVLTPTTVSGLKVVATLPYGQVSADLEVNFWSGSKALATNDTLNFTIFIASTSPSSCCSVGLIFSDGSQTTGIVDQNGFPIDEATDLSLNAKDQWYTRAFSLTPYNGKTVSKVCVSFGGTSAGVYTCYVQNVYLSSAIGTPFFGTATVTTQLNPMVVQSTEGYAATSVLAYVNPVVNPSTSVRISPAYSIDSVKLLSDSTISWLAGGAKGGGCTIFASYDSGVTYVPCVNGAPLPALPAGSNVAGLTMTLKELFSVGVDPTVIPVLDNVTVLFTSAPNATKSDVVKTFATQTAWNTGTYTGAVSRTNGDLTTGAINQGWANSQIINQTFFPRNSSLAKQSVLNGTYTLTVTVDSAANQRAMSRLDWAGTVSNADFTFDVDVSVPSTFNYSSELEIYYLQTYWSNSSDTGTGGYVVALQQSGISQNISIYRGTNSSTSTQTTIALTTQTTPTHVRISVQSGVHKIYFDNVATPVFSFTDTTFTSGQVGIGAFTFFQNPNGGGPGVFTFKNPVISPSPTETWIGPSTSISSLVTCGNSVISWTEANTGTDAAVFVESSIDGGSTYQTCTNGSAIPNLPSGTTVTGLSVKLAISFYCNPDVVYLPILRQLVWRVLGAYPGSSGTRSTVPLGNDTMVRANASGTWGPAGFDGQTYTKVGTGTVNLNGNEGQIANTTGDVHMVYGSRTWTDEEGTCRFSLSASTITGGIELRYADANNFYRLAATTTALSIIKKSTGTTTTLATTAISLTTGVFYRLRFRVVGNGPVLFFGRIWQDATLENQAVWNVTAMN